MTINDHIPHLEDATRPSGDEAASGERAGVYVYCVVPGERWQNDEADLNVHGIGNRGDRVRVVHAGDVAALVSDAPRRRYAISRENLLAHEQVIERALATSDVLPMQFGRIAVSDQEVKEALLGTQRHYLRELLELVRGKVELSLKVLWQPSQLFAEIAAEDADIRLLRDTLAAGASLSQRLMLGEMVEHAILSKQEREAHRLAKALWPHAADTRLNPARPTTMVLNAAFLVNRASLDEFDEVVSRLEAEDANRLIYRYVGPLPPYSFVDMDAHAYRHAHRKEEPHGSVE